MRKCHDFFVSDSYGNIPTTERFYQTMLTRIKPVGRGRDWGKQSQNGGKQKEKWQKSRTKNKAGQRKRSKKGPDWDGYG